MNIDRIIALISSVATLFTSILVLLTLMEMGRQRRTAYRPDIALARSHFYIYSTKSKGVALPSLFSNNEISDDEFTRIKSQSLHRVSDLEVPAFNIGMGAAKDIRAIWNFDLDHMIDKINSFKSDKYSIAKLSNLVDISMGDSYHMASLIENELNSNNFEYLLPAHSNNDALRIPLPHIFLILYFILRVLQLESIAKEKNVAAFTEISLELLLTYSDIGNNTHSKTYRIIPNSYQYSTPPADTETVFKFADGFIEVRQIL